MFHLFVELGDHHRFDDGQKFGRGSGRHAERLTERQRCAQIPTDDGAWQDTQLAAEATDKIPDLPAFKCSRLIYLGRAVFAGAAGLAALAVSLAPDEGPVGESVETFFSCSSSSPFET